MKHTISRGLINKFNRGIVSKSFFAREDVERLADSAETMTNFLPKRLGPMMFRPGFQYMDQLNQSYSRMIPFIKAADDTTLIINDGFDTWRWVKNGIIAEFENASSVLYSSTLAAWTDESVGSATSAVDANDYLAQQGTGTDAAQVYRQVTGLTGGQLYHYKIIIIDGPVLFQFGKNGSGSEEYLRAELDTGGHMIGITVAGTTLDLTVSNSKKYTTRVEVIGTTNVSGDQLGAVVPADSGIALSNIDLHDFKWVQSGDVLYFDGPESLPFEVIRWNSDSLGVQLHRNINGPYDTINQRAITANPSDAEGDANMVMSDAVFNGSISNTHRIIRYASPGQAVTATGSTNAVETDPVIVFGSGNARRLTVSITVNSGSYTDIHLEQSFDGVSWVKVKGYTTGSAVLETYDDDLDGSDLYYRLQVDDIGTANVTLALIYSYGIIEGEFRQRYDDGTESTSIQLNGYWETEPGSADASYDYYLGSWKLVDDVGGVYVNAVVPTAVAFFEGRIWHGGHNKFWSSVSDDYNNYSTLIEGDSAAIKKTIGFGPVEQVMWMIGTDYLFAGLASSILTIRSNNFAVPLTPTNTNIKVASTIGAAAVNPVSLDGDVIFVQRGKRRLFRMEFDGQKSITDDLNLFAADIFGSDIVRIEISRNPESRVWVLLENGALWTCLIERAENVLGWTNITTEQAESGTGDLSINDICVLPTDDEDELYISVFRRSSGLTFMERMGKFKESYPINENFTSPNTLDSYLRFASPAGTTVQMLHLDSGDTVATWEDGEYQGTQVLSGNPALATFTGGVTDLVVGILYTATWKANKLTDHGDVRSINQRQRIVNLGFVLRNYYYYADGFKYGPDTSNLYDMPSLEQGKAPEGGEYDFIPCPFTDENKVDPRIVLQTTLPVEVQAMAYEMKHTADKTPERGG